MNLHCFILLKKYCYADCILGCLVFNGFAGSMVNAAEAYCYMAHRSLGFSR